MGSDRKLHERDDRLEGSLAPGLSSRRLVLCGLMHLEKEGVTATPPRPSVVYPVPEITRTECLFVPPETMHFS